MSILPRCLDILGNEGETELFSIMLDYHLVHCKEPKHSQCLEQVANWDLLPAGKFADHI